MQLAQVSAYRLPNDWKIESVIQHDGSYKWGVRKYRVCLNSKGGLEYEPMSSERTEDFLVRCRFDCAEAAYDAWRLFTESNMVTPTE